jgi:hypothetical protein
MTVVDPRYAQEIFGGLAAYGVGVRHFFLKVPGWQSARVPRFPCRS